MEEQKKSKEVKLASPAAKKSEGEPKKYSYEQLTGICNELFKENQYLKQQLQHANNALRMFNRLDYLFKVMDSGNQVSLKYNFDEEFVLDCIKEIQEIVTIPAPEEKKEEKEV